jgi:hypothetical protein
MTNHKRDNGDRDTLDKDLETVRSAWSAMSREEPPELVDQAVLNRARRAVESVRRRPTRWMGAFATATVILLAVTLYVLQQPSLPPPVPTGPDGLKLERAGDELREKNGSARAEEQKLRSKNVTTAPQRTIRSPQAMPAPKSALPVAEEAETAAESTADSPALNREAFSDAPDPEAWIERLLALRAAGKQEELQTELTAFREAFPDYPLPPELTGN